MLPIRTPLYRRSVQKNCSFGSRNIICRFVHHHFRGFKNYRTQRCGYVYRELSLKKRVWICPNCGKVHKRDHNVADNIHRVGHLLLQEAS
ncbi:MAG: zinc ribbon domain-containing protein [Deltaproteobacteria bacterium]|nr:zinc ribbon domain-containing protein [Deltaproteobacteria bacterium]